MLGLRGIFTGVLWRLRFSFLNPEGQLQFSRSSTYLREKIFFKIFFFNFLAKSWHFKPILVKKKFQNFFKIFLSSKTAVRHNHSTKFKSNNWNCWSFTGTNFPPKEKFLSQKLWLWEVLKVGRDIFEISIVGRDIFEISKDLEIFENVETIFSSDLSEN